MTNSFVKKFLKGLLSVSFGTTATVLFHFFSIMAMVRYATVDDFGLYMLMLAIVHGLRIFSGLGLDLTLVKFTSAETENATRQDIFATIFFTRVFVCLLIGLTAYALGAFFISSIDTRLTDFLIYLPVLCLLTSVKELIFYYFQGLYQFKKFALINVFSAAFKFGLIFIFIRQNTFGLAQLIQIELIALTACLLVQLSFLPKGARRRLMPSLSTFGHTLRFGLPLYLNNILTFLYERSSIFIIGILLDPVSIALYEIAAKIPEGFQRLFSSFIAVYFPSLSGLLSDNKTKAAERVMNMCLILLSIGAVFLALVAWLFQAELVLLLFSEKYLKAAPAFALLMVNFQIIIISYTLGYSLVSAGRSSLPYKINSVASVVNIAASFLFIPVYGFIGAVYASLIMNATAMSMNYFHLRRLAIQPKLIKYLNPLLFAFILVGFYEFLSVESVAAKILTLSLYLLFCFTTEEKLRDLLRLRSKISRVAGVRMRSVS